MAGQRIQSLWVGARLTVMERLSIASFLHHGHDYHLFTYGPVEGLPAGAVLEDARAILPETMIFQYRDFPSYAGFSNFFRYKLLLERGDWWVDTDTVCLRPFDLDEPYVFASEPLKGGGEVATSAYLKAPADSRAMAYAWESCMSRRPQDLAWGETGPHLVAEVVGRFSLTKYQHPYHVFCPVGFSDSRLLTDPDIDWLFDESTRAVHLWNEGWRRQSWDKERDYPSRCLYERLKRSYLPARSSTP
jgi:hypothetical protein